MVILWLQREHIAGILDSFAHGTSLDPGIQWHSSASPWFPFSAKMFLQMSTFCLHPDNYIILHPNPESCRASDARPAASCATMRRSKAWEVDTGRESWEKATKMNMLKWWRKNVFIIHMSYIICIIIYILYHLINLIYIIYDIEWYWYITYL